MNKSQITLSYKGRTFVINHHYTFATLCIVFVFTLIFIFSFVYLLISASEVENLKKQLMLERTINITLTKEVSNSTENISKIAESITGIQQKETIEQRHIKNKIELYSILHSMHNNLNTINSHLSQKISKFRSVINVAKLNTDSEILKGINLTQLTQSKSSSQGPSKVQKASIKNQLNITPAINEIINTINIKQKGIQILEEYIASMPLEIPIAKGTFVSGYGTRHHPIFHKSQMHYGVDFVGSYRAKIIATGEGIVEKALYSSSYGNYVIIRHKNNVKTLYAHMSKLYVRPGQKVKTGNTLGLQGSTGNSTGAHVHYEIQIGDQHIDPLSFIRAKSLLK